MRLRGYYRLLDLSGAEDDLDDELPDALFLDPLVPPETEPPDLRDDELPEELPVFTGYLLLIFWFEDDGLLFLELFSLRYWLPDFELLLLMLLLLLLLSQLSEPDGCLLLLMMSEVFPL